VLYAAIDFCSQHHHNSKEEYKSVLHYRNGVFIYYSFFTFVYQYL